ncbi:MAG: molybdopterin-guanine dinucleotide biosynthesis protein B [Planctomycetota bacterium]
MVVSPRCFSGRRPYIGAMRTLSIVGRSGSGKTTLLVRLIPQLIRVGVRVAALKHSHHGRIEVDRPGKDSFRLREAGAEAVMLLSQGQLVQIETLREQPSIEQIESRLRGIDLLLVESWKSASLPSLEVIGESGDRIDPVGCGERLALVSDLDPGGSLPRFRRDDVEELARFVRDWMGK